MNNSFRNLLLVASAVLVLSNTGQAATIGYLRDAPGGDGPFLSGAVVSGAGFIDTWNGRAGTLDLELSLNGQNGYYFDLLTYCGDPFRPLSVGPVGGLGSGFKVVSMQTFGYSTGDIDAIERLWAMAFNDSTTSATKAAAFQFLLWEYIADPTFDLNSGIVRVTDTNVLNQALAWNNQLSNASAHAILLVLDGSGSGKQSFFLEQVGTTLIENPEPSTYALLGAGLIAFGYLRRKR